METENDSSQPNLNLPKIEPFKIPWRKIALLGFLTQLALGLLWTLVLNAGFGLLLSIAVIFRGLENLLIIFYLAAIPLTYSRLKRWALDLPFVIASSSVISLYAVYRFAQKLPLTTSLDAYLAGYEQTTVERISPFIGLFTFLIVGALLFLLATYLTNKLRHKPIGITILLVVVLGLTISAFAYQKPPSLLESLPKVSDLNWKVLPTNVPSWLKEYGRGGSSSCTGQQAKSAWYECQYYFANYPGYLSSMSQAAIAQARQEIPSATPDDYFEPSPFFWVQVIRDDKALSIYKYKNEACDWSGLSDTGASPRKSDGSVASPRAAKPKRCVSVKTPAGKTLYYESFLTYFKDAVQVPIRYYFEQKGNLIMIGIDYPNSIDARTAPSIYLTDPNFQTELYTFVDSFK